MKDPEHLLTWQGDLGVCTCGWSGLTPDDHARAHGMCGDCWGSGDSPYWRDGATGLCWGCGGDGSAVTERAHLEQAEKMERLLDAAALEDSAAFAEALDTPTPLHIP
jgi:hypothetical protein